MYFESRDSIDSGIAISDDEEINDEGSKNCIYLKTNEDWTNNNKIKPPAYNHGDQLRRLSTGIWANTNNPTKPNRRRKHWR